MTPLRRDLRTTLQRIRTIAGAQREPSGPGAPTVGSSLSAQEAEVVRGSQRFTMTGPERVVATMDAVAYVVQRDIPGAFVECGVWRGGSVVAMIKTLQRLGRDDRDIYLYDTFEGMSTPTELDTSPFEQSALRTFEQARAAGERAWAWAFGEETFDLEKVQRVIYGTGYPRRRLHFVVGRVEDTLPGEAPEAVALLRLDTDWYESTLHELVHLYPRIPAGGVLIIDDYGHWDGARKAVDEYFATDAPRPLLSRIDYSARMGVKD